jgi:hypothetical protein
MVTLEQTSQMRKQSWEAVSRFGLQTNPSLPLLELGLQLKSTGEATERLLCLHATAASAYRFDRAKAMAWLISEGLAEHLEQEEIDFLQSGTGECEIFRHQIEGMWALFWALGQTEAFDFREQCPQSFVGMMPDLRVPAPSTSLRRAAKMRAESEILRALDLAYCLHWAIRETSLASPDRVLPLSVVVVEERRRALEWLMGAAPWYEITLDT